MPKAGERFTDEELHIKFGVPTVGGIRVNREKRCIVLIHLVGADSGYTNTDRGTDVLYMGQNTDRDGLQDQEMTNNNLALQRSKEEGYTVLYFIKEDDILVFNSRVEYVTAEFKFEVRDGAQRRVVTPSEALRGGVGGNTKLRKVIEFKLRAIQEEESLVSTSERSVRTALPTVEHVGFEEIYSPPLSDEEIASIEVALSDPKPRTMSKEEFLDIVMDDKKLKEHIRYLDSQTGGEDI